MAADTATGVQHSVFTQCPKCETVFRLSAEALRAAGGQVRCGRCGDVFNALARLAEDSTGFERKGESAFELETRADEILHSTLPVEPVDTSPTQVPADIVAPPGVEVAQLQILEPLGEELTTETSLEFTLPPGELDRIFVESRPGALQQLVKNAQTSNSSADSATDGPAPAHPELEAMTAPHPEAARPPPAAMHPEAAARPERSESAGRNFTPLTRVAGLEVSEDVRDAMLSSYAHAELPEINAPRRQLPPKAWLGAAVGLGLLLIVQIVHGNGGWLAEHTHLAGGSTVSSAALSAYQLRQWGVTGDPGAKGTLRVRASIMNTAAQLQPYPLLRVTLANRFGTRVGAREFEPAEYLGKSTTRMLAPGERVDATLDIHDPGKDAEGFEIDVCVRGADRKVVCAGDAATRTK
jgi:predicted Zn finger-like uncharacterized protein